MARPVTYRLVGFLRVQNRLFSTPPAEADRSERAMDTHRSKTLAHRGEPHLNGIILSHAISNPRHHITRRPVAR
jgi:hypothetical protein